MRFVLLLLIVINAALAVWMSCIAVADFGGGRPAKGVVDLLLVLANTACGLWNLRVLADEVY
jgi:hypothetical protein